MFPNKERHWIKGPYINFSYTSWNQWILNKPYNNVTWSSYKPIIWNIKDEIQINKYSLQVIYMKPDGMVDMKAVTIFLTSDDESVVREWLQEQPWITGIQL